MAQVVFFNQQTNAYLGNESNVDPVSYQGRTDVILYESDSSILAVRDLIASVPSKFLIVDAGVLREMNQSEKDAVISAESTAFDSLTRFNAKRSFNGFLDLPLALRAALDIIKDEINLLRERDRDRATDVAAATSLADLKTRWAARSELSDRTLNQLKTALASRIDGGTIDEK